ncbi:MAG: helix-turn-helix transcriptional regulator [Planctomycetia bacterium]
MDDALPRLVDAVAVAALLSVSTKTVRRMVDGGRIPPPTRVGRLLRWRRTEVLAWIDAGCPAPPRRKGGGR